MCATGDLSRGRAEAESALGGMRVVAAWLRLALARLKASRVLGGWRAGNLRQVMIDGTEDKLARVAAWERALESAALDPGAAPPGLVRTASAWLQAWDMAEAAVRTDPGSEAIPDLIPPEVP